MLQLWRERLTILLLCLLPFHAFFVTVGTKILQGQHKSPPLLLSVWKEAFILLLLFLVVIEIVYSKKIRQFFIFDRLDIALISFTVLALCVSYMQHVPVKQLAYGFKYDLWPLWIFFICRRVTWSTEFVTNAVRSLLYTGSIVALIGFVFLVVPSSFLEWLGYSETHSLYLPHKTTAAFQAIGDTGIRRLQSVLSGPNQAGLWLLLPASLATVTYFIKKTKTLKKDMPTFYVARYLLITFAILLTLSRSAWVALFVILLYAIAVIGGKNSVKKSIRRFVIIGSVPIIAVLLIAPSIVLRAVSNADHIQKPLVALQSIWQHPFGLGLGSAGPASHHVRDVCLDVPSGANITWAKPYPELCLFMNSTQIVPTDRTCTCPFITENWYLQIGVETGILGGLLFLYCIFTVIKMLYVKKFTWEIAITMYIIGISIAAIFLHAWEDTAVAVSAWVLLATVLPLENKKVAVSSS